MRPRNKDRHLPGCMYYRHGACYLVRKNQWIRLDADYATALRRYSRLMGGDGGDVVSLINNALEDARARGLKKNTLEQYEQAANRLQQAFVEFAVDEVTPADVGTLMEHFRATPNFANRVHSLLRMAFRPAVRKGMCTANPVDAIDRCEGAGTEPAGARRPQHRAADPALPAVPRNNRSEGPEF